MPGKKSIFCFHSHNIFIKFKWSPIKCTLSIRFPLIPFISYFTLFPLVNSQPHPLCVSSHSSHLSIHIKEHKVCESQPGKWNATQKYAGLSCTMGYIECPFHWWTPSSESIVHGCLHPSESGVTDRCHPDAAHLDTHVLPALWLVSFISHRATSRISGPVPWMHLDFRSLFDYLQSPKDIHFKGKRRGNGPAITR